MSIGSELNISDRKMQLSMLEKLDGSKMKELLGYVINNSDECVKLLSNKIKIEKKSCHCLLCHGMFDPNPDYNTHKSCYIESDISGDVDRGACGCGDWDCYEASSCIKCGAFMKCSDGYHEYCYIGKHILNQTELNQIDIGDYYFEFEQDECDHCEAKRYQPLIMGYVRELEESYTIPSIPFTLKNIMW
eukprot:114010_1